MWLHVSGDVSLILGLLSPWVFWFQVDLHTRRSPDFADKLEAANGGGGCFVPLRRNIAIVFRLDSLHAAPASYVSRQVVAICG